MAYLAWVCSACRRPQVAQTGTASITCRVCGQRVLATRPRPLYVGADPEQARRVVQRAGAQMNGMPVEEYASLLTMQEAERPGRLDDAVAALASRPEFSVGDLDAALRAARVPLAAEEALHRLVAAHRVYEPRPGRYRWM